MLDVHEMAFAANPALAVRAGGVLARGRAEAAAAAQIAAGAGRGAPPEPALRGDLGAERRDGVRGSHVRRDPLAGALARAVAQRAAPTSRRPSPSRATLQRNGLDTFVADLGVQSDLTMIGVMLQRWPGSSREAIARRLETFAPAGRPGQLDRFKSMIFVLGEEELMRAEPRAADLQAATSLAGVIAVLLSAGCDPGAVLRLGRRWSLVLKDLLLDFGRVQPMSVAAVRTFIESASETERYDAWNATTTLDTLRAEARRDPTNVKRELYLQVLPALGMMFASPAGSDAEKARIPIVEVDRHIRRFLPTIGANVPSDRRVAGQISIVNEQDFQLAYERQWMSGKYPELMPRARDQCKAFVDVDLADRHIWIDHAALSDGTMIHEGMHKYADDELRNRMRTYAKGGTSGISMLDEGLTELFTRKACTHVGINRYPGYPWQHAVCVALERKLGLPILMNAYYFGSYDALVAEFERVTGRRWTDFAHEIEHEKDEVAATALI